MTTLIWDEVGKLLYETGVNKGVFYDYDGNGVAWNGLISVEENTSHQVQPVYFDGMKVNDVVTIGDFSATVRAFTYPDEFLPYEGILQDIDGIFITGQSSSRFGMSYQTRIGNDLKGTNFGYKIHLLYNLTANPVQKTYNTMSLETEPLEFEWEITAVPEFVENYRPTSHIIFDSRLMDPDVLEAIESILYGDSSNNALLPPYQSLSNFIKQ